MHTKISPANFLGVKLSLSLFGTLPQKGEIICSMFSQEDTYGVVYLVPTAPAFFFGTLFLPRAQLLHTSVPSAPPQGQLSCQSVSTTSATVHGDMSSYEFSLGLPVLIAEACS